jgi:hypothetical protein
MDWIKENTNNNNNNNNNKRTKFFHYGSSINAILRRVIQPPIFSKNYKFIQCLLCFGRTLFAHHPQGGLRFWKQRKLIQMEAFGKTPWLL